MNEFKWLAIMFMVMFIAMALSSFSPSEKERVKLDNCVELANYIGLDPNDDMRATYIENCYNE